VIWYFIEPLVPLTGPEYLGSDTLKMNERLIEDPYQGNAPLAMEIELTIFGLSPRAFTIKQSSTQNVYHTHISIYIHNLAIIEGMSCEDCAPGYQRVASARFLLGECRATPRCDCNGHSNDCDQFGRCLNCQHNTQGEPYSNAVDISAFRAFPKQQCLSATMHE